MSASSNTEIFRTPGFYRSGVFLFLRRTPCFLQIVENSFNFLLTSVICSVKITFAVQAVFGGIAQLARARGSYPRCPRFESRCRYQIKTQRKLRLLYGPVVKRLRHRPFTAVTRVRFSSGSPKKKPPGFFFYLCKDGNRKPALGKAPGEPCNRRVVFRRKPILVRVTKKETSGFLFFI